MTNKRAYIALDPDYDGGYGGETEHLFIVAQYPGLNQWASCKPVYEASSWTIGAGYNNTSNEGQYGFYSGPDLTEIKIEAHKVQGAVGMSTLVMDYKSYNTAQATVLYLMVNQSPPLIGSSILLWQPFYTFNIATEPGRDASTIITLDISAALAYINPSQDFWISAIGKFHYDGTPTSSWPNASSGGASDWMDIQDIRAS